MSEDEKLKLCPFCGAQVELRKARVKGDSDSIVHTAIDGGHDCGLDEFSGFGIEGSVVDAWQRRMTTPPTETPCGAETVERCAQIAEHYDGILRDNENSKLVDGVSDAIAAQIRALPTRKSDEGALVEALQNPSIELLNAAQEAAIDFCEIDGDAGAWISSDGIEAIFKAALTAQDSGEK